MRPVNAMKHVLSLAVLSKIALSNAMVVHGQ